MEVQMKRLIQIFVIGALVAVLTTLAFAAVPPMLNYQGKLTTASGAPVNDTIQMVFTIYDSVGTSLWTETQPLVEVLKGVFNVFLGSSNPLSETVFSGSERWLGIKVNSDAEITPRTRLTSVSYTFRTATVDGATGGNVYGDLYLHSLERVGDYAGDAGRIEVTNGSENTIIADGTSGTVGINTVPSLAKLEVLGDETSAGIIGTSYRGDIANQTSAGVAGLNYSTGSGPGVYGYSDNWHAVLGVNSNVNAAVMGRNDGPGPGMKAQNQSTGTALEAWANTGDLLKLYTLGPNLRLSVSNNGDLTTVGNANISGTCQVGGFKMSNGASNGYVLTSDATGVGTWQPAGGGADNDWVFPQSAGGTNPRPYLYTYGPWGIARYGNILFGNAESTHVNLGVACTTGTNGQNYKYCTVGGGHDNTASGGSATVGGGSYNTASNDLATVGGGTQNIASQLWATVGGGISNIASGGRTTVGGGVQNTASADFATVGGGGNNTASYYYATIGGGGNNTASYDYATIGGGDNNTASGNRASVGGGSYNSASGNTATIGGGDHNTASLDYATVGGGWDNTANGKQATVGGGFTNTASGYYATVGGGLQNIVAGFWATVGGGAYNSDSGNYSVIPGGYRDTLTDAAQMSMVFGAEVYVNNSYRVVFFEGTNSGRLGINRDDHDGGISYPIHVGTNTGNGNGAYLTAGGVWTNGSSRSFKENFQTLNSQELLLKISNLSVEAWNFKDSEERHIGPMAEDFVSAFDVGVVKEDGNRDNQYLSAEDVAGVALAGVKELIKENQGLKQTIEKLSQRVAELEKSK